MMNRTRHLLSAALSSALLAACAPQGGTPASSAPAAASDSAPGTASGTASAPAPQTGLPEINVAANGSISFGGLTVGQSSLKDAQASVQMQKAENSAMLVGGRQIPIKNTYYLTPLKMQGGNSVLYFDDDSTILQQAMIAGIAKPYPALRKELEAQFHEHRGLNRDEAAAILPENVRYEESDAYLNNRRNLLAVFKQGDTLIIALPAEEDRSTLVFLNSPYIPAALSKAEKQPSASGTAQH